MFIERLWRTVKYEEVYLKVYTDGWHAEESLANYFRFYCHERVHQSLCGLIGGRGRAKPSDRLPITSVGTPSGGNVGGTEMFSVRDTLVLSRFLPLNSETQFVKDRQLEMPTERAAISLSRSSVVSRTPRSSS